MESYPNEFTAHHLPLLFLAGLSSIPANSVQVSNEPQPFTELIKDLGEIMASKSSKGYTLWDNSRGVNCDFHVTLVDKVNYPSQQTEHTYLSPFVIIECQISTSQGSASARSVSDSAPFAHLSPFSFFASLSRRYHRTDMDQKAS